MMDAVERMRVKIEKKISEDTNMERLEGLETRFNKLWKEC